MARIYDLLDEPELPRDAVVRRLRELSVRDPMPDPRKIVHTQRWMPVNLIRTIAQFIACALFVSVFAALWWL